MNGHKLNQVKEENDLGVLIETETFTVNQGVRQGCVLSLLLFNLFLADLLKKLELSAGKLKIDPIANLG